MKYPATALLCTVFFFLFLLLGACALPPETQEKRMLTADPKQPYPPSQPTAAGDILHLPTGYLVTDQTVVDHALRARIIYVGEIHDNLATHRIQEQLLEALHRNNPGRVTLAMEMFTPSQQPVLDRWSAGELPEKDFLKAVDWYNSWGFDFTLYRDLLNYCRDHGIKILALNAERDLKHKLSRTPIAELTPQERALLPEMEFDDPYHQAMTSAFHAGHSMSDAAAEGFQRVQTLWDETMAENLANYVASQESNHQVMVVAGGNHIAYGIGIPRRVFRRLPATYLLIGTTETEESKHIDPSRFMEVTTPDYPLLPYHFLYYTAYQPLPATGVRLGAMIRSHTGAGVMIETLVPDSAAMAHDLRNGDVLLSLDGALLSESFDLIHALKQKQIGDSALFELLRGTEKLTIKVEFTVDNQQPHGRR